MDDNKVLLLEAEDTYYRQYPERFNYVTAIPLIVGTGKYYLGGNGNDTFLMDKAIVGLSIRFAAGAERANVQSLVLCKSDVLFNSFLTLMVNSTPTRQQDPMERFAIQQAAPGGYPYVQLTLPKGLNYQTSYIELNDIAKAAIVAGSVFELNFEYLDYQPSASDPV